MRVAAWERGLDGLRRHVDEHGHARLPSSYRAGDYQAQIAGRNPSTKARKGDLAPERLTQLVELGVLT